MIIRFRLLLPLIALVALCAPPARAADMAASEKLFQQRCAKCHGKTGMGDGDGLEKLGADVKPMNWNSKAEMAKLSDADLSKIIELGGQGVGKSKVMPAYQGKLSDAQVKELITYIRSLGK